MTGPALRSTRQIEESFWLDALSRTKVDAAIARPLIEGLLALRWLSDTHEARSRDLWSESGTASSVYFTIDSERRDALIERREAYHAVQVVFVPRIARWPHLMEALDGNHLGRTIDAAFIAVERENPAVLGAFPQDYSRPELGPEILAEWVRLVDRFAATQPEWSRPVLLGTSSGEVGARVMLAMRSGMATGRESRRGSFQNLLQRMDDQLRELDRVLKAQQHLRSKQQSND